MAASILASGLVVPTANSDRQTLTVPSVQAGDRLYVVTSANSGSNTATTPSGFTVEAGPVTIGAVHRTYVFSKDLAASDSGTTVAPVWATNGRVGLLWFIVRGGTQGALAASQDTTADNLLEVPAITPPAADSLLVAFSAFVVTAASSAVGAVAGWTEVRDGCSAFGSGSNQGGWLATKQLTGGAGSQHAAFSAATTSTRENTWVLAVSPTTTPPPTTPTWQYRAGGVTYAAVSVHLRQGGVETLIAGTELS